MPRSTVAPGNARRVAFIFRYFSRGTQERTSRRTTNSLATQDAVDIQRLTRYSLKDCSLRPAADGEFVSFAALQQEIERGAGEREGLEFLRSVASAPSVRARLMTWLKSRR